MPNATNKEYTLVYLSKFSHFPNIFINSNEFIYSHGEVSNRNSTLGSQASFPPLPELCGIGSSVSGPARLDLRLPNTNLVFCFVFLRIVVQ